MDNTRKGLVPNILETLPVHNKSSHSASHSPSPSHEPKYIFIGFFTHGAYGRNAQPYKANKDASISLREFSSVPKLMTYMNCAPGNVLIGEHGGVDNNKLTNYFKTHSDINVTDTTAKNHDKDKTISENFLNYVQSALKTLELDPRSRTKLFQDMNKTDIDVCRNTFICNKKVGISYTFPNKSFSTDNPPKGIGEEHWGIFIYNNNCGIEPGQNIELIPNIQKNVITDFVDDDKEIIIGYEFHLLDIISALTENYKLTNKDYLFLFDYSCSVFDKRINPRNDERIIRRIGNNVAKTFGLGKGKKRGKKRTRKLKKKEWF